tara:strand:- start:374 stop:1162 length:789 start_codon:yes stop_codon:yes gene_type:complete
MKFINFNNLNKGLRKFRSQKTFPFTVIDNFFNEKIAKKLEKEFPNYKDKNLHVYNNYCEIKKTLNIWNLFPPLTYNIFTILNSDKITKLISKNLKTPNVISDHGLHGGGWGMLSKGGKLNPHLDYSLHPKIHAQRKFNLIIFLSRSWKKNWGGELSFYLKNHTNKKMPGKLFKKILPKFNRAVIFDTSNFSWHGVEPIKGNSIRKTIAVYYLTPIKKNKAIKRQRALYAPVKKQIYNKKILQFIKLRSSPKKFSRVYITKNK